MVTQVTVQEKPLGEMSEEELVDSCFVCFDRMDAIERRAKK